MSALTNASSLGALNFDAVVGGDAYVEKLARPIHHIEGRQPTQGRMRATTRRTNAGRSSIEQAALLVEIVGDGDYIAANALAGLADVRLRNGSGAVDDRPGTLGEPGIEAPVQSDGGEDRNDDRRQRRDEAEKPDHAHVQPGARRPLAAGRKQLPQLPADHRRHEPNEHQVGHQQASGSAAGSA